MMEAETPYTWAIDAPGGVPYKVEAFDAPARRQALYDLPLIGLGSGLGYAIGHEIARHVLKKGPPASTFLQKHGPRIAGGINAIALPLLQRAIDKELRKRRQQRREQEAGRGGALPAK
jgi:hypothetical protein